MSNTNKVISSNKKYNNNNKKTNNNLLSKYRDNNYLKINKVIINTLNSLI